MRQFKGFRRPFAATGAAADPAVRFASPLPEPACGCAIVVGAGKTAASMGPASLPPELTGTLVRGARAMLKWSTVRLASAAGVSMSSVRRLEEGTGTVRPRTREAIRRALEAASVTFIVADDGKAGVLVGGNPVRSRLFEADLSTLQP